MALLVIECDQAERTSPPVFGAEDGNGVSDGGAVVEGILVEVGEEGIEPPTPAFSGLASTIRISLILFTLLSISHAQMAELLVQRPM